MTHMIMQDKITDIICDEIESDINGMLGVDDAAKAIVAALPSMVKPLVWGVNTATIGNKTYKYEQGHPYTYQELSVYVAGREEHIERCETIKEAKALANEHHRAEIMSAFE